MANFWCFGDDTNEKRFRQENGDPTTMITIRKDAYDKVLEEIEEKDLQITELQAKLRRLTLGGGNESREKNQFSLVLLFLTLKL